MKLIDFTSMTLGVSVCLGATIKLLWDFFTVYFIHGQTSFIIDFNSYGEAILEMIIMAVGIVCLIYTTVRWLK